MTEDRKITRRISAYVHAIEQALASMSSVDRDAVLEDVEDHIEAALQERASAPTLNMLETVLDDLGSPESYAAELQAQLEPATFPSEAPTPIAPASLCMMAPLGLTWSLLALLIALPALFMIRAVSDPGTEPDVNLGEKLFQILAWFSLAGVLGGPVLSTLAVSRIRASAGRLCGLGMAVLGMYLLPLAAIDLFLYMISDSILVSVFAENQSLGHSLALLVLILCFVWNGRVVCRSINRLRHRDHGPMTSAPA